MGLQAVTVGCSHVCPLSDGNKPHVGGNVITGSPNVSIEKKPACRQGDQLQCASPSMNSAQTGSMSVFINSKPAVRLGDNTAHGGKITQGAITVYIG